MWHALTERQTIPDVCITEVGCTQRISSVPTSRVNFSRRNGQLKPMPCDPFPFPFSSTTSMQRHLVVAAESCITCCSVHLHCVCRNKCFTTVAGECCHMSVQSSHVIFLCLLCILEQNKSTMSVSCDNDLLLCVNELTLCMCTAL